VTESRAREEICRVGRSLFERGYVHATAGNISVRLDDADGGFLITPSDACLGSLDPARLARLDGKLHQVSGDKASKTIALHYAIYAASQVFDPQTRCVIHTHSTHCVAWSLRSCEAELLPPLTPYFVMKVGHVPHIAYHAPGDPLAAQAVADAIARYGQQGRPIRAVMLARLGPNVWHDSPSAALACLEELEETARLCCLCPSLPEALNTSQIDTLRQRFGARW
jgi:ribulose-5-phosphate 4-epimerase/fuculose-1-phosphate aldolase